MPCNSLSPDHHRPAGGQARALSRTGAHRRVPGWRRLRRQELAPAWGAALVVALVSVGGGWLVSLAEPTPLAIVLMAIMGVLAVPIAWRVTTRRFDVFEPVLLFVLAWGVMFVVRPWADLTTNHAELTISGRTIDSRDTYLEMLLLGLLGAAGFVWAYMSGAGGRLADRLPSPPWRFDPSIAARNAMVVGLVGLGLFSLYLVSAGGISALLLSFSGRSETLFSSFGESNKYYLFGVYMLVPATLTLLALGAGAGRSRYTLLGVAAGTVLVVTQAPIGSRGLLFPLIASGGIYYYLTKKTRPSAVAVISALLLALTVSAFLGSYRDKETRENVGGAAGTVSTLLSNPSGIIDPILFSQDTAEAPALAAALALVPEEIGHTYGGTIVGDLLFRPIPRALWPRKPVAPREQVVERLFGRLYYARAANPEFSVLLYPYLDFGWPGVAGFLALFGVVARALYEYTRRYVDSVAVRLLFALALPMLALGVRDSPVDNFARLAFLVAPVWFIFYPTLARRPIFRLSHAKTHTSPARGQGR